MIGQDLSGLSMLDLFGGSGLMALEAASRGAAPVTVVDRSATSLACIRSNVAALGAPVTVIQADASAVRVRADLVYLDPPFREPIAPWLALAGKLSDLHVVAEARAPVAWPELAGFELEKAKTYGDTAVAVYTRRAQAGGEEVSEPSG
jgi:16S rRNA G966 N2-methylase RsmD